MGGMQVASFLLTAHLAFRPSLARVGHSDFGLDLISLREVCMNAVIGDPRRVTRALLACGMVAGPLFFSVAIIQAVTRPGYNIRQNAISQLSLGDLGWIQMASFILTGLLA